MMEGGAPQFLGDNGDGPTAMMSGFNRREKMQSVFYKG